MIRWDSGATLIVLVTLGLMLWMRSSEDRKRIGKLEEIVEDLKREAKQ